MTTQPRNWDNRQQAFVIRDTETCVANALMDDGAIEPAVCVTAVGAWRVGNHSDTNEQHLILSPQQAAMFGMQLVWAAMETAPDTTREE